MKVLRRILLNTTTGASVIACLACLLWWAILSHGNAFGLWRHPNPEPLDVTWLGVWAAVLATALLPAARIILSACGVASARCRR